MKIIKEGNKDGINDTVRFECDRCGCVFEAEKGEYTVSFDICMKKYYWVECPCCNANLHKS